MFGVRNKETKIKLLKLCGVFIMNFEKFVLVINLFPVKISACFRVLVFDFEEVSINWKYLPYNIFVVFNQKIKYFGL